VAEDARPLRLSAVVACYQDAQAIPVMHQRLVQVFTALAVDYEIIFVNDGSPDDTDGVLKELAARDDHVIAVEHSRNFGSQSAFVSGMQVATGDAVVLLDGDLQDPPEVIAAFYEKWRQGNDVVYGRRVQRETSRLWALCCQAFYRIFRAASSVPMPLDAGEFSLMDRKVVDALLGLPESDLFVRGLRSWVGFRQTGVDYFRPKRMFGHSTQTLWSNIWWARKAIFSFSFKPVGLLGYAGAALTALSLAAGIYQVVDKIRHPALPLGLSTIIVLMLFFGGINLLAIAVLGEYLIKIVEETKRRPRFIRKAVRHGGEHFDSPDAIEDFLSRRRPQRAQNR
jgi:polyisoprenyl-phosphate glycosyltransferase